MDDELKQLEDELAALRPVRPSARVEARIAAELKTRPRFNWAWAALPMAAALAVVFAWQAAQQGPGPVEPETPPADPVVRPSDRAPAFKPVAAQNVLYDARDDGILTLQDGRKVRRTSRSYVDTVVWQDPESKASVSWSVPRREVRLSPVSFQ